MKIPLITISLIALVATSIFGIQTSITPSLSVTEEYTDNLFLTDKGRQEDYITSVTPGIELEFMGRNSELSLLYEPTYVTYREHSDLDTWRQFATMDYTYHLTQTTRMEVSDHFTLTDERISDEDPTIRSDFETYYTNTASMGVISQFRGEDSAEFRYTYSILENDDPGISDNSSHTPSFLLNYTLVPNDWILQLEASYQMADLDRETQPEPVDFNRSVGRIRLAKSLSRNLDFFGQYTHTYLDFDGDTENYQIYDPGLGFEYSPDERVLVSLAMGYYIIDRDRIDNETSFNLTSEISSEFELRRTTLTIEGASGYDQRYLGAESLGFNVFYELGGILSYQFFQNFSGDIFGRYRYDEYIDLSPDRVDVRSRIGLGFSMEPFTWMSIRVEGVHRRLDSDAAGGQYDYEENRGLVRIELSPSQPFRLSN